MLKQRERATYGHHGTSIGKSRTRSPQTVSALQMEDVERKRKKRMESILKGHSVGDKRLHMERHKKAPKHQKQEHKHPGTKPKRRAVQKDPQLEARLKQAGPGDTAEWERRKASRRAEYASMPEKVYSPEEQARFESKKTEYTLDRYAQPSAEQLAEHRRKEELHHQEQQARGKQQELFEKHGKRQIDPAGFAAPQRIASPPQVPESKIGGARGQQARTAQIMRKRELTSEVQQVQQEQPGPSAKRQKPVPRDLEAMARGQGMAARGPMQAEVVEAQPLPPGGTSEALPPVKKPTPVQEFTTMGTGETQFRLAQEKHKREQEAQAAKQTFERSIQERQGVEVQPMALSDPVSEQYKRAQRGQAQDERERMAQEDIGYMQQQQRQGEHERSQDEKRMREHAKDKERLAHHARQVVSERKRKAEIDQARRAVLVDLQKTGGPRDVFAVIPDPYEKAQTERQKAIPKPVAPAKGAAEALQRYKDPERERYLEAGLARAEAREPKGLIPKTGAKPEKRPLSRAGEAAPDPSKARLVGPSQGAMLEHGTVGTRRERETEVGGTAKRKRGDDPGSVPAYLEHRAAAERQRLQMLGSMKQQHIASLAQQTNNPNRTETVNQQPDVKGQDPAMGTVAPAGTGQEAQNTSAQVNTSAVDQDLLQLQAQLGGGGGGEMGTQTMADGSDVGLGMPRPTGDKPGMFGGDGGIEAVEERREETKLPTPEVAQATLQPRPTFASPVPDSARLHQLQKIKITQKTDSQIAQEAALTEQAQQLKTKLEQVRQPSPQLQERKQAVERLLKHETFEQKMFRKASPVPRQPTPPPQRQATPEKVNWPLPTVTEEAPTMPSLLRPKAKKEIKTPEAQRRPEPVVRPTAVRPKSILRKTKLRTKTGTEVSVPVRTKQPVRFTDQYPPPRGPVRQPSPTQQQPERTMSPFHPRGTTQNPATISPFDPDPYQPPPGPPQGPPGPPGGGGGGGGGGRGGRGGRGTGRGGRGGHAQGGKSGPVTVGGHGGTRIHIGGGGWGGGGAVAAASSSGAGTGGGQGTQQAVGTLLAAIQKPKKKKQSGITAAKKRYTDKRKVKLGELRALKSKRLREHATKTKKLPKAERAKQRKAFKAKVASQFKEVTKRFPTARGLKDLQTVKGLIDKIERVRLPS